MSLEVVERDKEIPIRNHTFHLKEEIWNRRYLDEPTHSLFIKHIILYVIGYCAGFQSCWSSSLLLRYCFVQTVSNRVVILLALIAVLMKTMKISRILLYVSFCLC